MLFIQLTSARGAGSNRVLVSGLQTGAVIQVLVAVLQVARLGEGIAGGLACSSCDEKIGGKKKGKQVSESVVI
jgi:hypothetical protein